MSEIKDQKTDSNRKSLTLQESSKSSGEKQNNSNSSEEIQEVIHKRVEGTPFSIVSMKKEEWVIVTGAYRVTPKTYRTEEEAIKDIERKEWHLIVGLASAIVHVRTTSDEITRASI